MSLYDLPLELKFRIQEYLYLGTDDAVEAAHQNENLRRSLREGPLRLPSSRS